MDFARASHPLAARLRLAVALVIALTLLVGCNRTGDFGRPHQFNALHEPPKDKPADAAGLAAPATGTTTGTVTVAAPLTDDERQLRDLARNVLAAGSSAAPVWPAPVGRREPPVPEGPEARRQRYADYISRGPFRSVTARYSRLIDDTRDDIMRLEPFFQVARRVADLDDKRRRGLGATRSLPPADQTAAQRRMRENMMLMAEVHRTLSERAATYRLALERLVVAAPSPMAIDAERSRLDLERRLSAIQVTGRAPAAEAGPPAG